MKLVYFSWIRERLGLAEEEVELPASIASVGDLIAWQKRRSEAHEAVFEHDKVVRVALDQEHAGDHSLPLEGVREVAFFPPMTGG